MLMCKVISINVNVIKKIKSMVDAKGSLLLADAIMQFGQQAIGELLATDEEIQLVPDGGVIKFKD